MNIKNLQIMYDYLISNRELIESDFNISTFRTGDLKSHVCNSQGCVLGWGVGAFPFEEIPLTPTGNISFWKFSTNILGLDDDIHEEWHFLFSSSWAYTHLSSFYDATKRLKWVIDGLDIELNEQYNVFKSFTQG